MEKPETEKFCFVLFIFSPWFEKLKSMKPAAAAQVPVRVICDGFLHKQKIKDGQLVGNKKLRYCVLSEFSLQVRKAVSLIKRTTQFVFSLSHSILIVVMET